MGIIFSNIPELEGTNTEIPLANLSVLEGDLGEVFEKRIAHLSELARSIVKDGGADIDLIKSIILSIRSDGELSIDSIPEENISDISSLFNEISIIERVNIFKRVFKEIPDERYKLSLNEDFQSSDSIGRIAYIQNSYNDSVFGVFSALLHDAKASYFETINEVCESVVSGKCQYCIFPIETSKDGKLISFYELVFKYGLLISAEYDLHNSSGDSYTRYALLSRSVSSYTQIINKKKKRFLQIAYCDLDNMSLKELLSSADLFGLKLQGVDTFILNNSKNKKVFCMEFLAEDADVQTFMTYLTVDCPDHIFIGFYQHI